MEPGVVSLTNVSKRYRNFHLDAVTLEAQPGRIMGLIGPNGAGKSTLFRIVMGLVRPDSGVVRVLGQAMPQAQTTIKRAIGFVSEDMRLHPARDIRWHASLVRGFCPDWDDSRLATLAERFSLRLDQRGGELSRGQSVKALLVLALARQPRLLLLDEPTAGLDPMSRAELMDELIRVVRERAITVLFSSHLTEDIERMADDVAFIHGGRLIEVGTREALLERAHTTAASPAPLHAGGALHALFSRRIQEEAAHAC